MTWRVTCKPMSSGSVLFIHWKHCCTNTYWGRAGRRLFKPYDSIRKKTKTIKQWSTVFDVTRLLIGECLNCLQIKEIWSITPWNQSNDSFSLLQVGVLWCLYYSLNTINDLNSRHYPVFRTWPNVPKLELYNSRKKTYCAPLSDVCLRGLRWIWHMPHGYCDRYTEGIL